MAAVVALAALGLAGCDDGPKVVTQNEYDAEAIRLCDRRGEQLISIEELESRPLSDAAKAAFLSGEMVPAARAIVRSLDAFGYPEANAAEYSQAANDAFEALADLEVNAIALLDRRRQGLIVESEDPFADLAVALAAMDIPC
jgi:hypothetical protein